MSVEGMKLIQKTSLTICLIVIFIIFTGALGSSVADDDHGSKTWYQNIFDHDDEDDYEHSAKHREREHEHHREGDHGHHGDNDHSGNALKKVNNPTYKEKCGACHLAYQPELLPSASWMKILADLDDHFGEAVELDDESKKVISGYLTLNSAEKSSAKRAVKIMRSVGKQTPVRITDIHYIREKHHDISPDILKRKAIGSLSNCAACHTNAESGYYDEDHVRIPR